MMVGDVAVYLDKALESLVGAESEFANARYNNCANRCYYACFQAAVAALLRHGIRPAGPREQWGHTFVQAQFVGQLINRRKVYPASLRTVLAEVQSLRQAADYERDWIAVSDAEQALRWTQAFVAAVRREGER